MDITTLTGIVLLVSACIQCLIYRNQRDSRRQQNMFAATNFMASHWEEIQAIHILKKEKPNYDDWESTDKLKAAQVCLCFHVIGSMVRSRAIPDEICDLYYFSTPRAYEILDGYLTAIRTTEEKEYRHESYWFEFDKLVEKTIQRNDDNKRIVTPFKKDSNYSDLLSKYKSANEKKCDHEYAVYHSIKGLTLSGLLKSCMTALCRTKSGK